MNQRVNEEWEVGVKDVATRLASGDDLVLIDCRTAEERAVANIEGSIHIPLDEFRARVTEIESHDDRDIVVYCHGGVRSLNATVFLRQEGVESAWSMAGGIDAWSQLVDPDVPRYR